MRWVIKNIAVVISVLSILIMIGFMIALGIAYDTINNLEWVENIGISTIMYILILTFLISAGIFNLMKYQIDNAIHTVAFVKNVTKSNAKDGVTMTFVADMLMKDRTLKNISVQDKFSLNDTEVYKSGSVIPIVYNEKRVDNYVFDFKSKNRLYKEHAVILLGIVSGSYFPTYDRFVDYDKEGQIVLAKVEDAKVTSKKVGDIFVVVVSIKPEIEIDGVQTILKREFLFTEKTKEEFIVGKMIEVSILRRYPNYFLLKSELELKL